jgi:diaminopimelate decarboxylase
VRRAIAVLVLHRGGLAAFDTLDVGGGFPVAPTGSSGPDGTAAVPSPALFAATLDEALATAPEDRRPARLAIEPGRYLVARAGTLVARVLHARERAGSRMVVLDAGMTELIRPALYGAIHPIVALTSLGRPLEASTVEATDGVDDPGGTDLAAETRVEGPICESTDALGVHRLPPLARGDLVAILDAGAYGAALGSTYNGRPRPPQVLVERDGNLTLGRRRGSVAALG